MVRDSLPAPALRSMGLEQALTDDLAGSVRAIGKDIAAHNVGDACRHLCDLTAALSAELGC